MSDPKLHHYVPRFYLSQFADEKQQLWVYDKHTGKIFKTNPKNVAAETQFYRLPDSAVRPGEDPLAIEKALSRLETEASTVLMRLSLNIDRAKSGEKLNVTDTERKAVALFISVQHFRTVELRDLLLYFIQDKESNAEQCSSEDRKLLHFTFLAESGLIEDLAESIFNGIWLFAKNTSSAPLLISDHPVSIKTGDNKKWIKGLGPLKDGEYIVFPMSPKIILYCKEPQYWSKLKGYDLRVSPVELTDDMVLHENCGQAFMATRYLISCKSDFEDVKAFLPSIGTDLYAPEGATGSDDIKRTATYNSRRVYGKK
jgi:hypothetical protein